MGEAYDVVPGRRAVIWMNIVGLVLVAVGLVIGGGLWALLWAQDGSFDLIALALVVLLTVAVIVLHEGVHGAAMALLGIRPRFGAGMLGGAMPVLYVTAAIPGTRVSTRQFVFFAAAPAVLLNLVMVGLIAAVPWGGWLVVPFAIHLGGCVGDFWMIRQVLRAPSGSTFEDLRDGVRVYPRGGVAIPE
jgi:hypothetical protein